MLNTRSFSEVFEAITEDSNEELQSSMSFEAGWESALDAHGFAQIMAQTQTYNVRSTSLPRGYARFQKQRPTTPPPIVRRDHSFDTAQTEAFSRLQEWSSGRLTANFNSRELKSAYRAAMLKTHPDQGGSSESFHEAKKCYHILCALVKNEA